MNNVLVCVTPQKSCDRLIRYGKELADGEGGELMVVHIIDHPFDAPDQPDHRENLEHLHRQAVECGANLIVIRSDNVLFTLRSLVTKRGITKVVMGEHRLDMNEDKVNEFQEILRGAAVLIPVPLYQEETEDPPAETSIPLVDDMDIL